MLVLKLLESGVRTNNKGGSDQTLCNSVEKLYWHNAQIKIEILILSCSTIIPVKMSKIKIAYKMFYQ